MNIKGRVIGVISNMGGTFKRYENGMVHFNLDGMRGLIRPVNSGVMAYSLANGEGGFLRY